MRRTKILITTIACILFSSTFSVANATVYRTPQAIRDFGNFQFIYSGRLEIVLDQIYPHVRSPFDDTYQGPHIMALTDKHASSSQFGSIIMIGNWPTFDCNRLISSGSEFCTNKDGIMIGTYSHDPVLLKLAQEIAKSFRSF